jgi:hypothetical protein
MCPVITTVLAAVPVCMTSASLAVLGGGGRYSRYCRMAVMPCRVSGKSRDAMPE